MFSLARVTLGMSTLSSQVIRDLTSIVGEDNVVTSGEETKIYSRDALLRFRPFTLPSRGRSIVVVKPYSAEEVEEIVKLANTHRVPIVPYGGGTGLMGGAASLTNSIVINLSRMNKILEINVRDRTVTAEAGITLGELDAALREKGLMLGHDPWSRPRATLGGSISTNGMGYTAAGYGSIRRQVLGLEVVLPTGAKIETRPAEDSSTGPSLTQLFIGAEGTLGIITKATLRVFPQPERQKLLGYEFETFADGFNAIMKMYESRAVPTVVDYGEEGDGPVDPMGSYPANLFLMVEGFSEYVEAVAERVSRICEQFGGRRKDDSWAVEYWETRHEPMYRYERIIREDTFPEWLGEVLLDFIHIYLPASRVLAYREKSAPILAKRGIKILDRSIWKQPELFSMVMVKLPEPSFAEAAREMLEAFDELMALCHNMGGSMEYCHGVGVRLSKYMEREHGIDGLEALRQIKRALDPNNIMNPGKLSLS